MHTNFISSASVYGQKNIQNLFQNNSLPRNINPHSIGNKYAVANGEQRTKDKKKSVNFRETVTEKTYTIDAQNNFKQCPYSGKNADFNTSKTTKKIKHQQKTNSPNKYARPSVGILKNKNNNAAAMGLKVNNYIGAHSQIVDEFPRQEAKRLNPKDSQINNVREKYVHEYPSELIQDLSQTQRQGNPMSEIFKSQNFQNDIAKSHEAQRLHLIEEKQSLQIKLGELQNEFNNAIHLFSQLHKQMEKVKLLFSDINNKLNSK